MTLPVHMVWVKVTHPHGGRAHLKVLCWLHLYVCHLGGDARKAELSWDCPQSSGMWPLQHGDFEVIRLLPWQLKAPT